MTAIGDRILDLLVLADIRFFDPATATVRTVYVSNRSWITNPSDSVAPNRQYVGLITKPLDFDFSWFSGDSLGGRSTRNFGEIHLANPVGAHSLSFIDDDDLSVQDQVITYRLGRVGGDLSSMITLSLRGRDCYPSADGNEVIVDVSDGGQSLDTPIQIDKFWGLHYAARHLPGEISTVPSSAAFDQGAGQVWMVDFAYRLPPWATIGGNAKVFRIKSAGDDILAARFLTNGRIGITLLVDVAGTPTLSSYSVPEVTWQADGRWHRFIGRVEFSAGSVAVTFTQSTRTTSAAAIVTSGDAPYVVASTGVEIGDVDDELADHGWLDIDDARVAVTDLPDQEDVIARMRRPLHEDETSDYELYVKFDENTGTTSADETGNGHTVTIPSADSWVQTFEGPETLAGKDKPLSFGRIFNAPVTWSDQGAGAGVVHSRGYLGVEKVYEGGERRIVGWPDTRFMNLSFDAATKTIFFPEREPFTGVFRLDAQPSFAGLVDGQKLTLDPEGSGVNGSVYTVDGNSTPRSVTVVEAVTDETGENYFIIANNAADTRPEVQVHHASGALLFKSKATLPATAEIYGDMGTDVPSESTDYFFPDVAAAIMRIILIDWAGEPDVHVTFAVTPSPAPPANFWYHCGAWVDQDGEKKIREVMDEGADSLWARWGEDLISGEWKIYVIENPSGTDDVTITQLETHSSRQVRSVPPVGGFSLEGCINYKVLQENEIAGVADRTDSTPLTVAHLVGSASPDAEVVKSFPLETTPKAIRTWIRQKADLDSEAQRRYDILKSRHEIFDIGSWLYGLNQNLLDCIVNLTHPRFSRTVSGKDFWLIHLSAEGHTVTMTLWG